MNEPVFSIIIPTFNSEGTIHKAIASILHQTFTDFEVLIMDGASMDKTIAIALGFKDDRIKAYSEPDHGIYDAMNKSLDHAKGGWVYFLGGDDELYDNQVLDKVYANIKESDVDVFYGQVLLSKTNTLYCGECDAKKLIFSNISHQAIFTNKNVFNLIGRFDLKYRICADHILNVKWFFNSAIKRKYADLVIARFDQGGVSSQRDDEQKIKDLPGLVRQHAGIVIYCKYYVLKPFIMRLRKKIKYEKNRVYALFK